MANVKRTHKGMSKGLKTIILKLNNDLHNYSFNQSHSYLKHINVDHLLCNETLEDLEAAWATPRQPISSEKSKPKARNMLKSFQKSPVLPAASCHVPPNSPADVASVDQGASNPYITYLVQSWDQTSSSAATNSSSATSMNKPFLSKVFPERENEPNLVMINPDDILVIPDSTREELPPCKRSNQTLEKEQLVPEEDRSKNERDSEDFVETSLFLEDVFFSLSPQETACELDHVVPKFELEE